MLIRLLLLLLYALALPLAAKPLRIATANDPQTMDPHALSLLYHSRVMHQIYEGLVNRDEKFRLEPALALSWQAVDARTWRFKLRPGVKFHDGSAFTADDAVFSIERALHPQSQRAPQLRGIKGAKKIDALTIDVLLDDPDAVLPLKLWQVAMMSRAWCEAHQVARPQDYNGKQETFAVRAAMGTGPFRLERYEADVRTTLVAHRDWWGRATRKGNVEAVEFLVIQSDATRLAALGSGQVDLVLDPPFQDVARLRQDKRLRIVQTADIGTQYLALDQRATRGNPFQDKRVRRAIQHALDMELVVRQVLRGQGEATGAPLSQLVEGAVPELEARPRYDPAAARALLKEAGYPDGFETRFDCVSVSFRQAVCQAMTAMLRKVGIRASLQTAPAGLFFPKLTQAQIALAEFGWSAGSDAWNVLHSIAHGHDGRGAGLFNAGRFADAKLDALIDAIRVEPDLARRRALVGDALRRIRDEALLLPIYRTAQIWAMREQVSAPQWPNGIVELRWARVE